MGELGLGPFSAWHILIATIIVAMLARPPSWPRRQAGRLAMRTKSDQLWRGGTSARC
jgi:hypothetical protein